MAHSLTHLQVRFSVSPYLAGQVEWTGERHRHRRDLAAGELSKAHLTVLARELCADQAYLLLGGHGLRLDLPHQLYFAMATLEMSQNNTSAV